MAALRSLVLREEVRQPQREIAIADLRVVRADRIVRHDNILYNKETDLSICFIKNLENIFQNHPPSDKN